MESRVRENSDFNYGYVSYSSEHKTTCFLKMGELASSQLFILDLVLNPFMSFKSSVEQILYAVIKQGALCASSYLIAITCPESLFTAE